jgi:hypothetical protein
LTAIIYVNTDHPLWRPRKVLWNAREVRRNSADEGLEAGRGGGDEPPGVAIAHAHRVRDAAQREDAVAGVQDVLLLAHLQRDLALEDGEALVVGVVDVQRRLVVGRAGRLEQRERAAGLGGADVDADAVVQ